MQYFDQTRLKTKNDRDSIITNASIQINKPSLYDMTDSLNKSITSPIIMVTTLINVTPITDHIAIQVHFLPLFLQPSLKTIQSNANFINTIDIMVPPLINYIPNCDDNNQSIRVKIFQNKTEYIPRHNKQ